MLSVIRIGAILCAIAATGCAGQGTAAAPRSSPHTIPQRELRSALEAAFALPSVYVHLDAQEPRAPFYRDLEKAGILERYAGKDVPFRGAAALRLTALGRRFAANHLWDVERSFFRIPVGRDRVTGVGIAHFANAQLDWVNFRFKGSLNWQGRALLTLGPAHDWIVGGGFPRCLTTLDRIGRESGARAELWIHDDIVTSRVARSWGMRECAHRERNPLERYGHRVTRPPA